MDYHHDQSKRETRSSNVRSLLSVSGLNLGLMWVWFVFSWYESIPRRAIRFACGIKTNLDEFLVFNIFIQKNWCQGLNDSIDMPREQDKQSYHAARFLWEGAEERRNFTAHGKRGSSLEAKWIALACMGQSWPTLLFQYGIIYQR